MLLSRIRPWIAIILLLGLSGCAAPLQHGRSGKGDVRLSVPFFPQERYRCGPASLAGVLNYWGVETTPEGIAEEIFSASAKGTLDMDMLLYPRRHGLRSTMYAGSLQDLRDRIREGHPLIVLVDMGLSFVQKNHFMVVVGYNDEGVFVHSGKEREGFIPFEDFERIWERAGRWTLLIQP